MSVASREDDVENVDEEEGLLDKHNKRDSLGDDDSVKTSSFLKIVGLNAYVFGYGMTLGTMGVIVLPLEAVRMFPENHALFLGIMLGATGLAQLVCPLIGYYSDRCTNPWGRRRPYIFSGAIITVIGYCGMWAARQYIEPWSYTLALLLTVLGLNVSYSGFTGLLPDFVAAKSMGTAGGVMAVMGVVGACTGFGVFGFALDPQWAYLFYTVVVMIGLIITCVTAREIPLDKSQARPVLTEEIWASYVIDKSTHHDFYWVFVIRTLYYMGVSVQAFILFFVRDVTHVDDPGLYTALIAILGQVSAACVALPAGRLSDTIGRKILVRLSCIIMGTVYMLFLLLGDTVPGVLSLAFAYGFGNGVFIAVDYALAVDTLPDKKNAARDMGIWGVASFLGTTFGPLVMGPALYVFGDPYKLDLSRFEGQDNYIGGEYGYRYSGYVWIMSLATVWLLLVLVLLEKIKGSY